MAEMTFDIDVLVLFVTVFISVVGIGAIALLFVWVTVHGPRE